MQNPPSALGQLISELSKLEESPLDPSKVAQLLSETNVTDVEIQPLLHFRKDRYTRNLVYRSSTFDVIVLCWPPNSSTAVHDHNRQLGWVRVLKGALEETRYVDGNSCTEMGSDRTWLPRVHGRIVIPAGPAVAAVDSAHGVHKLGTLDEPAVSLHIYSKPLDTCLVFDEQDGHIDCKDLEYDTTPDSRTKQLS
ncbi:MAG: hypothetical protein GY930_00275 [bacterium]|nr:hypothetical protein [bacterium]